MLKNLIRMDSSTLFILKIMLLILASKKNEINVQTTRVDDIFVQIVEFLLVK